MHFLSSCLAPVCSSPSCPLSRAPLVRALCRARFTVWSPAVTTGTFSEADLDFSDVFPSVEGAAGTFGEDADAFLSGDVLFWDMPVAPPPANTDERTLDTFIQGFAGGRTLVGAL
jgi:hypothetical protein